MVVIDVCCGASSIRCLKNMKKFVNICCKRTIFVVFVYEVPVWPSELKLAQEDYTEVGEAVVGQCGNRKDLQAKYTTFFKLDINS